MKNKSIIAVLIVLIIITLNISYAADGELTNKVVSIVYDDSGSMMGNNSYCYSDYALQILTASLGSKDELNIVKMSEYYKNNEIDLSNQVARQKHIDEIRNYEHNYGTPFESVTTAKDWLINKSKFHGDAADYWLVVITDGAFSNLPADVDKYLKDLNSSFNNLNFELVLLNIGYATDVNLRRAVNSVANCTNVDAKDKQSIYESLLKISNMINNGASDKIVTVEKSADRLVRLHSKYPLKKMLILIQNTDNYVKNVTKQNSKLKTENYNVEYPVENLKGSLTHVINVNENYLNTGYYEIEFAQSVDMNNITFLCEAYVECKIKVVDENDNELNDSQMKFLTSNKVIKVKCELYNAVDGTKLVVDDNPKNINVQIINDKNKYKLVYDEDKKAYYGDVTLIEENNNIYAIAEAKDLFRIKSNVIFVDTLAGQANIDQYENNMVRIEIPYSSSNEYQNVGQFTFSFIEQEEYNVVTPFELHINGLPKGIKIEYDGKEYDDGAKISMTKQYGKSYVLNILSNKEYTAIDEKTVSLKLVTDELNQTIYWTTNGVDETYMIIAPKPYPIQVIKKSAGNEIDVQEEKIKLSVVRTADETNVLSIVGNVSVEDIKDIVTNSSMTTGFTYSVKKNKEENTLDITVKPNIFALFKENKLNINLEVMLNNEREKATYEEEFIITNIDVLGILTPYIIALIGVIIAIGYVGKKKFNKKSQITITENGERVSYALKPNLVTILVPYMAHKTKIGMIEFKAGKNNQLIYSARNLDVMQINGEGLEAYKETHSVNLDKMIMKKDCSNIIINAFDVQQKYEYLSKEIDMASGGDEYSDSYSDGYSDDYMNDYTDDYTSSSDYDSDYTDYNY